MKKLPDRKFAAPELSDVHSVKILLCYLLDKLDRPVEEDCLDEIVRDSEVINYFCFSEAMADLLKTGAVSRKDGLIALEEKGRLGSEYFNRYIPITFRRSILSAAYSRFAKMRRDNEFTCFTEPCENGCTVNFTIKDNELRLMSVSLYAPDEEQAENLTEKISRSPSGFYMNVIKLLLENPEEKQEIDI